MANRYLTFEELVIKKENIFKPDSTLGRHHLEIHPHFKGIKARGVEMVNIHDEKDYMPLSEWVIIEPGGTLGYDCGSVWAILPCKKMAPLQKLRAEFKLPKDKVFVLPAGQVKKVNINEKHIGIDTIYRKALHAYWLHEEICEYWGENCAFTTRLNFKLGPNRVIEHVFIFSENMEAGVQECFEALKNYHKA